MREFADSYISYKSVKNQGVTEAYMERYLNGEKRNINN